MPFKLKIVTPNGIFYDMDANMLNIRLGNKVGYVGILKNHMPLVAPVEISTLIIKKEQTPDLVCSINGGVIYVSNEDVKIITPSIENKDKIDIERAKKAYERAKARLETKKDTVDITRAELALQRALNRINTYNNK